MLESGERQIEQELEESGSAIMLQRRCINTTNGCTVSQLNIICKWFHSLFETGMPYFDLTHWGVTSDACVQMNVHHLYE